MIYDFENKSLKSEGKNWIAPNAVRTIAVVFTFNYF